MAISQQVLSTIPLFEGVEPRILEEIAGIMQLRLFARRETVIAKGANSDSLAFLLEGSLQIVDFGEDGSEVGLHLVKPGDYFGELSLIDNQPRSATVVAVVPSTVGLLPRKAARQLFFGYPLIAERVMIRLAAVVRQLSHQRTLLSISNAQQRVYLQLLAMARSGTDPVNASNTVIENLPTQQQMAFNINTSRETVSRAIHALQKRGILKKEGRVIIVLQPDLLRKLAEEGPDALDKRAGSGTEPVAIDASPAVAARDV
jgi:CRP-like cAMP-binding protein